MQENNTHIHRNSFDPLAEVNLGNGVSSDQMQILSHSSDRAIVSIRSMCPGLILCVCGYGAVEGTDSFPVIWLRIYSNANTLPACVEVF